MESHLFQTKPSSFAKVRFTIMRIVALAAICFAVFQFNENPFFFSILIMAGAAIFLLSGSKQIDLYKTHITVSTKSVLKNSPFTRTYNLSDLKEITADIPNEISEMVLTRVDPLSIKYRIVIMPVKEASKSFWITTTRAELEKAVMLSNDLIKESQS